MALDRSRLKALRFQHSKRLMIGASTFESLNLSEDDKQYLRSMFIGKTFRGVMYVFQNDERVASLLEAQ